MKERNLHESPVLLLWAVALIIIGMAGCSTQQPEEKVAGSEVPTEAELHAYKAYSRSRR